MKKPAKCDSPVKVRCGLVVGAVFALILARPQDLMDTVIVNSTTKGGNRIQEQLVSPWFLALDLTLKS
jgi:hypothetical protein